ncbi:MAG: hypothetical protein Q8P67_13925 [archaeon]|nr:hypothetical protein [archaeon]
MAVVKAFNSLPSTPLKKHSLIKKPKRRSANGSKHCKRHKKQKQQHKQCDGQC